MNMLWCLFNHFGGDGDKHGLTSIISKFAAEFKSRFEHVKAPMRPPRLRFEGIVASVFGCSDSHLHHLCTWPEDLLLSEAPVGISP